MNCDFALFNGSPAALSTSDLGALANLECGKIKRTNDILFVYNCLSEFHVFPFRKSFANPQPKNNKEE